MNAGTSPPYIKVLNHKNLQLKSVGLGKKKAVRQLQDISLNDAITS